MEHHPAMTDWGDDDASSALDPDIILITDYLAGEMSSTAAAAVEHRLAVDEAFFEKVWPLVRSWTSPLPMRVASTHDAVVTDRAERSWRTARPRREETGT